MNSTKVPFSRPVMAPEATSAVDRVLRSGWMTTGPECAAFENEFASWVGAEHAITVSSCTAAIELSLRALHLPPGSRVLVPTITFCGAVEAVVHAGLVPVLTDVDVETGEVSAATCAAAARHAGGVDAMLALHYAGYPAQIDELAAAACVPLTRVVEDAAHGLGTWVGDRQVGSLSRATCFSFYATKNLPIGEGGMITTDDPDLAQWVRSARMHGMSSDAWRRYLPGGSWRYSVNEAGLKANLSDVQAAIGRVQLRHLEGWQRRREQIAARYSAALAMVPGLELPRAPVRGRHAWHLYIVRVKPEFGVTRDALSRSLAEQDIGTSVHFIPLHHMPRFREVAIWREGGTHGADSVFEQLLSLPMHQGLTDDEVDAVCAALVSVRPLAHSLEVGQ
ncbi:MAG TPA: DegT/DnrJ/EryC1/StrS aminotransferase family protein [Nocardioidaceae bacterium]|nr:DegT/DnrJ/EryC1/StrS aminotransferase family protein [Nocardioidaceae bacterium]